MADGDLRIDIVQLDPDLPLPSYARAGDAGLDLRARTDALVPARGGRALVPTGIAVAIPDGWVGLVVPRSGLALRHGVALGFPAEGLDHAGDGLGVRGVVAGRGVGRDAHHLLEKGDLLVEVGVDPGKDLLLGIGRHGLFPVLAPPSNQAPNCARSASVMWVRFASGMAFSCTVCW